MSDKKSETPRLHTRREFNKMLLAGAIGGLVAGAAAVSHGTPAFAADDAAKHACAGMNDCKGQGGCKTDHNDCAGQNDCKGQGGCATVDRHSCAGQNDCKGQGGCKTDHHDCAGQNDCKGQGGCAVPVDHGDEEDGD